MFAGEGSPVGTCIRRLLIPIQRPATSSAFFAAPGIARNFSYPFLRPTRLASIGYSRLCRRRTNKHRLFPVTLRLFDEQPRHHLFVEPSDKSSTESQVSRRRCIAGNHALFLALLPNQLSSMRSFEFKMNRPTNRSTCRVTCNPKKKSLLLSHPFEQRQFPITGFYYGNHDLESVRGVSDK